MPHTWTIQEFACYSLLNSNPSHLLRLHLFKCLRKTYIVRCKILNLHRNRILTLRTFLTRLDNIRIPEPNSVIQEFACYSLLNSNPSHLLRLHLFKCLRKTYIVRCKILNLHRNRILTLRTFLTQLDNIRIPEPNSVNSGVCQRSYILKILTLRTFPSLNIEILRT